MNFFYFVSLDYNYVTCCKQAQSPPHLTTILSQAKENRACLSQQTFSPLNRILSKSKKLTQKTPFTFPHSLHHTHRNPIQKKGLAYYNKSINTSTKSRNNQTTILIPHFLSCHNQNRKEKRTCFLQQIHQYLNQIPQ